MKKLMTLALLLLVAYFGYQRSLPTAQVRAPSSQAASAQLQRVFDQRQTSQQVQGRGAVSRVLADDTDGSRHQRFVLRLDSGQTLLVAHNIDVAPRIPSLRTGDTVLFYGEYEWNDKGGVIHWTHADPQGRHVDGWLERNGRRYQ